jgi:hypothetical protein
MRLKVWQLMQGQTGVQAMRFNITPAVGGKPPIVTYHAINTKGTGGVNGRDSAGAGGEVSDTAGVANGDNDASDSKKKLGDCAMGTHFKDRVIKSNTAAPTAPADGLPVKGYSGGVTFEDHWETNRRKFAVSACDLSGDPADPVLIVHLVTPVSGKVVVSDLYLSDLKNCA